MSIAECPCRRHPTSLWCASCKRAYVRSITARRGPSLFERVGRWLTGVGR